MEPYRNSTQGFISIAQELDFLHQCAESHWILLFPWSWDNTLWAVMVVLLEMEYPVVSMALATQVLQLFKAVKTPSAL